MKNSMKYSKIIRLYFEVENKFYTFCTNINTMV